MTQRKVLLEDDGSGHQGYDELDATDIPSITNISGNAATVTTNANLTGDVTSSGNATTIGAGKVTEAMQVLADNTTQNVSTSKHGYAPKSPNDATKYLDGTGAYSVPSGGSAGAMVLLEQHTASTSATLDFTAFISSTYDEYLFEGVAVQPATNNAAFWVRIGTGGGPTWDAGANYFGANAAPLGSSNTNELHANNSANQGVISYQVANGAAFGHCSFNMRLTEPQNTSHDRNMYGTCIYHNGTQVLPAIHGTLWINVADAMTGVRFLFSSGNIASGVIRVYGIAK